MDEKSKVIVTCADCKKPMEVTYSTFIRKKDNVWRCKKCLAIIAKSVYNNLTSEEKARRAKISSEKMKNYWKTVDQNQKKTRLDSLNKGYQAYDKTLSSLDKEKKSNQQSIFMKGYWNNLDSERKDEILKPMIDGFQQWYQNLSDEEKKDHHKYIQDGNKKWWDSISEEDRNRLSEIRSTSSKEYWDNITNEQRIQIGKRQSSQIKEYWNHMTPEQYLEWDYKRAAGFNQYLDDLDDTLNKNETSLMNYLKFGGIMYESHWYNKNKHPDFDKLFPINPVTESRFVSPYHQWDFMVFTKDCSVLIDIDGSIHNNEKITHKITYFNGKKIQLSDIISFNDSQRLYKTDGLNAYVVLCYDDNLNDNTAVVNINTNETMNLISLISILIWMNLSEKEKEEMLKLI